MKIIKAIESFTQRDPGEEGITKKHLENLPEIIAN